MDIRRVCAYGRVSTKHEEQESSIETQRVMFKKWIEVHKAEGYKLVDEVYEKKSATLITKRPKFMQMISDAKQGHYDTLLFKDSKRFSRNAEDFLGLVEDLKLHGVNIIFITECLDSSKENDRTMLSFLGIMAENYSNALHNNLQNSLRVKFESELGRVPGDVFGYQRVKGDSSRADIIPEQADIIVELFKRYADGEGIASITQDFIKRDIRTYRKNKISMFALRRYIRNPLYKGVLVMNKMQTASVRTTKRVVNDESKWIIRERPDLQIVDTDLWEKCNKIMDANKQKMVENSNGKIGYRPNILTDKLFSKVVVCGCCGRNYNRKESHHRDKDKRYIYLMCGYKKYNKKNQANLEVCTNEVVIRLDYLVAIVSRVITSILMNDNHIEELVQRKIEDIFLKRERAKEEGDIEGQLMEARNKLKRVADLYKDGFAEKSEYDEIKRKVKDLEARNKISFNLNKEEIHELTNRFVSNLAEVISQNIVDEGGVDVKKFNRLFEKIVVDKDRIDIIFRAYGGLTEEIDLSSEVEGLSVFVPKVDNNFSKYAVQLHSKGYESYNHRG
ncbi:MAG: recombinase family protein [Butyrivibrio hungatei]|nr:recombinase family protein [Butyrivibrio hungatei]